MQSPKSDLKNSTKKEPDIISSDNYSNLSDNEKEQLIDRQIKELAGMLIEQYVKRKTQNGK